MIPCRTRVVNAVDESCTRFGYLRCLQKREINVLSEGSYATVVRINQPARYDRVFGFQLFQTMLSEIVDDRQRVKLRGVIRRLDLSHNSCVSHASMAPLQL